MKTVLYMLAALAPLTVPAAPAVAAPRIARCVITSDAGTWRGPCWFEPQRGGSFEVAAQRGNFNGTEAVSVFITSPGVAEVRGLTGHGINSNWGTARRSPNDRACWVGEGFSVCVY